MLDYQRLNILKLPIYILSAAPSAHYDHLRNLKGLNVISDLPSRNPHVGGPGILTF